MRESCRLMMTSQIFSTHFVPTYQRVSRRHGQPRTLLRVGQDTGRTACVLAPFLQLLKTLFDHLAFERCQAVDEEFAVAVVGFV